MAAGGGAWAKLTYGRLKGSSVFVTGAQVTRVATINGLASGDVRDALRQGDSLVFEAALEAAPGTRTQADRVAVAGLTVAPPRVRSTPIGPRGAQTPPLVGQRVRVRDGQGRPMTVEGATVQGDLLVYEDAAGNQVLAHYPSGQALVRSATTREALVAAMQRLNKAAAWENDDPTTFDATQWAEIVKVQRTVPDAQTAPRPQALEDAPAAPPPATTRRVPARIVTTPGMAENTPEPFYDLHQRARAFSEEVGRLGNNYGAARLDTDTGRGDLVLAEIQRAQGFDTLPQLVSRRELDRMVAAGEVDGPYFRGAGGTREAEAFQKGNLWSSGSNGRMRGAGSYISSAQETGREYANGGQHLRMALRRDARVIEYSDAMRRAQEWKDAAVSAIGVEQRAGRISSAEAIRRHEVVNTLTHDVGYWAAAMGYDAIDGGTYDPAVGRSASGKTYVILNRSAVVVSRDLEW